MTIAFRGVRRASGVTAAAFSLLCLAHATPARAADPTPIVPPGGAVAVDASSGSQTDPHTAGPLTTYTDDASGTLRIHYRDTPSGTDALVPISDTGQDALADVSGTVISYVHFAASRTSVWTFDTATGAAPTELDPQSTGQQFQAAIGGSTVAVQDYGLHGEDLTRPGIVAYDRSTGARTQLTASDATGYSSDPAVSPGGDVVSWTTCPQTQTDCHVYAATRSGGTWSAPRMLGSTGSYPSGQQDNGQSDTNGSVVVYSDTRDGESDIYWENVAGGAEGHLVLPGSDRDPSVSGDLVSFEHLDATGPVPQTDIYAYDLASGSLYRLTDGPGSESLSDVSVAGAHARVVWRVFENGADNVYSRGFDLLPADTVAPTISLIRPTEAAAYLVHQQVTASFSCDDAAGSGVATCDGTLTNGGALDTTTAGTRTFTVTASDVAGNSATKTVAYSIGYNLCLLYDAGVAHRAGSTIPLKLQTCDFTGHNMSTAAVSVTAGRLVKRDNTASATVANDAGNANPDGGFRYDAGLQGYIYNLSTKGLTTGTWVLTVAVANDSTAHSIQFDVR